MKKKKSFEIIFLESMSLFLILYGIAMSIVGGILGLVRGIFGDIWGGTAEVVFSSIMFSAFVVLYEWIKPNLFIIHKGC